MELNNFLVVVDEFPAFQKIMMVVLAHFPELVCAEKHVVKLTVILTHVHVF